MVFFIWKGTPMETLKTVIFDMDGVIFDTEYCYLLCWKEVAPKYHIENAEEIIYQCMGTSQELTKKIVLENLGQDFDYDNFSKDALKIFNEKYAKYPPKKKGIEELLQYLKNNHYKIGLASSTRKEVVIQQLTNTKLIQYFDEIVGGDMVSQSKPNPDIYLKACSLLNEKPENCIAIEDSYNGIKAAYNANMKPIMVPDLLKPNEQMKQLSYIILDDLLMVKSFLEKQ